MNENEGNVMKPKLHSNTKILLLIITLILFTYWVLVEQDDKDNRVALQLKEVAQFGTGLSVNDISYKKLLLSPDEEYIAVLSSNRIEVSSDLIEIWNVNTQSLISTIINPFGDYGFGVFAWSPDGSQIATITGETELYIWDTFTGELVRTVDGIDLGSNGTRAIEWRESNIITTGSFEYLLWNLETDTSPQIVNCHPWSSRFWWSPNGEYIATMGGESSLVWICDKQFEQLLSIEGYTTIEWSPDSTEIATVGILNTLRIWSVSSGEALATSEGGENNILDISWHIDGKRIVTKHLKSEIQIWKRESFNYLRSIGSVSISGLTDVTWIGNQLITTNKDGVIQVWDVE